MVPGVDPRALRRQSGPVGPDPQLRRPVGPEQEHVAVLGQPAHVRRPAGFRSLPGDLDIAVQLAQPGDRGLGLRPADVAFGVEDLPAEVRQFDLVGIDAVQAPHSARGQRERGDAAGAAHAEDRHPRIAQQGLRFPGTRPRGEVEPPVVPDCPVEPPAVALGETGRQGSGRILHIPGGHELLCGCAQGPGRLGRVARLAVVHDLRRRAAAVHGRQHHPPPAVGIGHLGGKPVSHSANPNLAARYPVRRMLRLYLC